MSHQNPQPVVLPDEMIVEILSYVDVKTLMQLRSVSKAWKSLISNPTFVNLHLQRSARNPHLTLLWYGKGRKSTIRSRKLAPFPVRRFLKNPLMDDNNDDCFDAYYRRVTLREHSLVVGSYNGLVCVCGRNMIHNVAEYWLDFHNPAMGTRSEKLGHFLNLEHIRYNSFRFSFGYDISIGTYKVVAFRVHSRVSEEASWGSEVKIFNLQDNCWRKIQSFPVAPLGYLDNQFGISKPNDGVHLIGSVNWLALSKTFMFSYNWKNIAHVKNFVIVSLSLSTETYTQLLLPKGFNEVPRLQPILRVLRNCLCFSHDFKGTEFVIWQMREFGVRESWTQLIKISYETLRVKNLPMDDHIDYGLYHFRWLPLYLSENSNTLIFANNIKDGCAIIYSWKDDKVEKWITKPLKEIDWFSTMDYVDSLVPLT